MNHSTKILSLTVITLVVILLAGARFGATWAGGSGMEQHTIVTTPSGATYERGQIIAWEDTDTFIIGETTVSLDENTEVKIVSSIPGQETINVIQGRVLVQGPLNIEVRELDITVNGTTSFVHYSWLDEIDLLNIDGTIEITDEETNLAVNAGESAHMKTLAHYEFSTNLLDLEHSSAASFYEKTLK